MLRQRFLPLSLWEPRGLLGWNSQQKKALLYLFVCPPDGSPCCVRTPLCVCSRQPTATCLSLTQHHPVIKMPAGSIRSVFVSERFGISPPVKPPGDPERKSENDWSRMLPVKRLKKKCYITAGIQIMREAETR